MSELVPMPILFGSLSLEDIPILYGELSGDITYQSYDGDYRVVPLIDYDVELETENKVLNDNVIVKRIPYHEIPNPDGGISIYLGEV